MDKKYIEMLLNLMDEDSKIILHRKGVIYEVIKKEPDYDWLNPLTGEIFLELRKLGE